MSRRVEVVCASTTAWDHDGVGMYEVQYAGGVNTIVLLRPLSPACTKTRFDDVKAFTLLQQTAQFMV